MANKESTTVCSYMLVYNYIKSFSFFCSHCSLHDHAFGAKNRGHDERAA
jgi:hypothetical protein